MKNVIALVLSEIAAAMIGLACWEAYGDPWAAVSCPLAIVVTFGWVWAVGRDRAEAVVKFHEGVEKVLSEPSEQDAFRRDVVAVAYGEMDEEEFDRKWAGRVPPSPRRKEKLDPKVELFKELMAADIKAELERPSDGKATWTCNVTLGIHEDGPCQCIELASSPAPLYREGQYVRFLGLIWRVRELIPCHGPAGAFWWGYYVQRGDDIRHPDEKDLEFAFPRPGEPWGSVGCGPCEGALGVKLYHGAFIYAHGYEETPEIQVHRLKCGCLYPLGVRTEDRPQSVDPTKAPRNPVVYIVGNRNKPEA